jgi:hypothetical protein
MFALNLELNIRTIFRPKDYDKPENAGLQFTDDHIP